MHARALQLLQLNKKIGREINFLLLCTQNQSIIQACTSLIIKCHNYDINTTKNDCSFISIRNANNYFAEYIIVMLRVLCLWLRRCRKSWFIATCASLQFEKAKNYHLKNRNKYIVAVHSVQTTFHNLAQRCGRIITLFNAQRF